jgi:hypothetical protein
MSERPTRKVEVLDENQANLRSCAVILDHDILDFILLKELVIIKKTANNFTKGMLSLVEISSHDAAFLTKTQSKK